MHSTSVRRSQFRKQLQSEITSHTRHLLRVILAPSKANPLWEMSIGRWPVVKQIWLIGLEVVWTTLW